MLRAQQQPAEHHEAEADGGDDQRLRPEVDAVVVDAGGPVADGDEESRSPVSSATVAYLVRAVTPGSFAHPAATVEDMYRPDRFGRTATGAIEVQAVR